MYPPLVCCLCCKTLSLELEICDAYRLRYKDEIEKDDQFASTGETVKFPLDECFNALELQPCCRREIMTKLDKIVDVYGMYAKSKH